MSNYVKFTKSVFYFAFLDDFIGIKLILAKFDIKIKYVN